MLSVGDHVYYKDGTFPTKVLTIEIVQEGHKHGANADEVEILDRSVVMLLRNRHWAYGDQVEQVTDYCECGRPLERGNLMGICLTCEKVEADVINDRIKEDESNEIHNHN